MDRDIFGIVRDGEQRLDERCGGFHLAARERDFGAMPASRHVRRQYRFELVEDFLRTLQLATCASRPRPIRTATGRTARAIRRRRHRALRHRGLRPWPIRPSPPTASPARRACGCRGPPRQSFAQCERLDELSGRLAQRRPRGLDLPVRAADGNRSIEQRMRFLESMEALGEPRAGDQLLAYDGRVDRVRHEAAASLAAASARSWSAMRPSRSPRRNSSSDNVTRSSKPTPSARRRSRLSIEDERLASAIRPLV